MQEQLAGGVQRPSMVAGSSGGTQVNCGCLQSSLWHSPPSAHDLPCVVQVMDMGSGQVYFWDSNSDEVAWEPPEGAKPRSEQANQATFAASKTEAQQATNDVGEGSPGSAPAAMEAEGPAVIGDTSSSHALAEAQLAPPSGRSAPAAAAAAAAAGSQFAQAGELPDGAQLRAEEAQHPAATPEAFAEQRRKGKAQAIPAPMPDLVAAVPAITAQARAMLQRFAEQVPHVVRLAIEADIRQQVSAPPSEAQYTSMGCDPHHQLPLSSMQPTAQLACLRWQQLRLAMPTSTGFHGFCVNAGLGPLCGPAECSCGAAGPWQGPELGALSDPSLAALLCHSAGASSC